MRNKEAANEMLEKTTIHFTNLVKENAVPKAMTIKEIQAASERNVTVQALRHVIRTNRWYENPLIQHNIRTELSDIDRIVMGRERIVLRESLCPKAM
jgi:hypothetical protein